MVCRVKSGGACNACIDYATMCPKSMGLVKKCFGATLQRPALGVGIAISGDHDDRYIGSSGLCFRQELKTPHGRHIDVGQNEYERNARCISDAPRPTPQSWDVAVTIRAGRALSPLFVPNCRGDILGGGHAYAHRTIEYDIKHWISRKRSS